MPFSAAHADHVTEESLSAVMHEYVLKTAEIVLAPRTNVVAQAHIITEVAEPGGQIVFLGVQWVAGVTQAERL